MKIYLAWVDNEIHWAVAEWKSVLSTYYMTRKNINHIPDLRKKIKFRDFFLDCWAYSAWTRWETISVHDYSKYVQKIEKYVTVYAHLDVKWDSKATMDNLEIMEKTYWLNPIPVWHVNTWDFTLLEKLLKKYDYIALWAIAWESFWDDWLTKLLNRCFKMSLAYWKDKKGKVIKKYHGFWLTTFPLLMQYPWYTVDSTSWLAWARYGGISYFNKKLWKMTTVSYRDKKGMTEMFKHIPKALRNLDLLCDTSTKRNHLNRSKLSADAYDEAGKYITDIWTKRGIEY